MFTSESDGERILEIGQHLATLWAIVVTCVLSCLTHGVEPLPGLNWRME